MHQQIHHTVGVAPLVVVPRHDLEEALLALQVVLQGGLGVVDGGVHVVDEIRRDQLLISEGKDALHVGLGCLLHQGIDLLNGGVLLSSEGQIHHGHIWSWHAEGHAGQLALGGWQDLTHSLGCTRGAGNNVARRSTSTTPVLGGHTIHGLLGGRVGMDGGHQALLNSNALLQEHMADGCQAIGGAGSIGHHIHAALVVFGVVHTTDQSLQIAFARGADDDLLGTSLDVSCRLVGLHEDTSRLNHKLHTHLLPGQGLGTFTAGLDALDLVAVHDELVLLTNLHVVLEFAVHRVILHLIRKVLRIRGHIHHAHHVQLAAQEVLIANGLEDHTSDAAEAVNADLGGHGGQRSSRRESFGAWY
mmetsp:Transcript_3228/g.3973  ORF Transcript_3228/g.3973 Transcript_3228/m.3973 type:complete len:359 (-) Transcript_3228:18-1094(-)